MRPSREPVHADAGTADDEPADRLSRGASPDISNGEGDPSNHRADGRRGTVE